MPNQRLIFIQKSVVEAEFFEHPFDELLERLLSGGFHHG